MIPLGLIQMDEEMADRLFPMKTKRERGIGKVVKTARGFELIYFKDADGEMCSLQESSAIPFIRLGYERNMPQHLGQDLKPRMHLHRNQVKQLVASLTRWLEKGSFK